MRCVSRSLGATAMSLALASSAQVPAIADAAPLLTKARARVVALDAARYAYLHTDTTTRYVVEPAEQCARRSRGVVDCQAQLFDDLADGTTITCDLMIRVRLNHFNRTAWNILGEPACA